MLEKIEVEGKTSTPDFTVSIGGHPLDLETVFSATVDGTNGDTLLHPVTARLLNTVIVAQGGVVKSQDKDKKGKEITLDVTVDNGRIEDLLRLAVKSDQPPLTGAINFRTKFDLPPGKGDLTDRLNLNGKFDVAAGAIHQPGSDGKDRDSEPQGARPAGKQGCGQQRVSTEGQLRARQRRDRLSRA